MANLIFFTRNMGKTKTNFYPIAYVTRLRGIFKDDMSSSANIKDINAFEKNPQDLPQISKGKIYKYAHELCILLLG